MGVAEQRLDGGGAAQAPSRGIAGGDFLGEQNAINPGVPIFGRGRWRARSGRLCAARAITGDMHYAILRTPSDAWTQAYDSDRKPRDGTSRSRLAQNQIWCEVIAMASELLA